MARTPRRGCSRRRQHAAHAGRPCENAAAACADAVERGMALAQRHRARARRQRRRGGGAGPRRAGPAADTGLRYSHLGFAYRDAVQGRTVWRVAHKLNHCGSAERGVVPPGPGRVLPRPPAPLRSRFHRARAASCSRNCCRCCATTQRLAQWHDAALQHVGLPVGARPTSKATSGRSKRWPAPPSRQPASRRQAQAWLQLRGYEPTTLRLGAMTRLGGRATPSQHRVRRPPERQALFRSHRDRDGRLGVCVAATLGGSARPP